MYSHRAHNGAAPVSLRGAAAAGAAPAGAGGRLSRWCRATASHRGGARAPRCTRPRSSPFRTPSRTMGRAAPLPPPTSTATTCSPTGRGVRPGRRRGVRVRRRSRGTTAMATDATQFGGHDLSGTRRQRATDGVDPRGPRPRTSRRSRWGRPPCGSIAAARVHLAAAAGPNAPPRRRTCRGCRPRGWQRGGSAHRPTGCAKSRAAWPGGTWRAPPRRDASARHRRAADRVRRPGRRRLQPLAGGTQAPSRSAAAV